ncbi:hypothetical protein [Yoonia sp.]|uniref:hypothetical protein n=1 Tax=Yoonia sp. TaxID=2212373 RepID=UPI002E01F401|nr:hypothetical protein [Yoonia sp.]
MAQPENWHLDKRVPIALIFAIAVQTGGALWWAASIQARVGANETAVERLDAVTEAQRNASQSQAVQLGRIEEQLSGLRGDLRRLINQLERLP